jgi:nanoRNase/pAp phosphatase (c-di-AMP/oligoRNAs hydrolase)
MQNDKAKLKQLIDDSKRIIILQADNPDGDSLASSLALEQILHELGKEPLLYCGVDLPQHHR